MSKEIFVRIMREKGLVRLDTSTNLYMLVDCNLVFECIENGEVLVHGIIPMDLANEMYQCLKNAKNYRLASNSIGHVLVKPEDIACHKDLDFNKLSFEYKLKGLEKKFNKFYEERRKQLLKDDYDNCYIDFSYIYTPEALEWFIDITREYYSRKNENKMTLK